MSDSPPPVTNGSADPADLPESEFCEKTGLAVEVIRELRKEALKEGVDFEKKGGRVMLRPKGVERLLEAACARELWGGDLSSLLAAQKKELAPALAVTLVIRRLCQNPRIVKAAVSLQAVELVNVRVPGHRIWKAGQEIEALAPVAGAALWRLASVPKKVRRR